MRDYGKVHTSFWSSATIGSMSEDARTLALYLLTSPHTTIAGVMRLPDGYVCEDLRWSAERVSEGFAELFRKGFANRCETTKWVWICKHFDWNQPENPNQRKAAAKVAQSIPSDCTWKPHFIRLCGEFLGLSMDLIGNPSETVTEPFRNQKQEQKQEQEQEKKEPSVLVLVAEDGQSKLTGIEDARLAKANRLAQVTANAVEAFNLAPFTKRNGGACPNVSLVNEVRQREVKRCVSTASAICKRLYGSPAIVAEFWTDYWATVDGDQFASGRLPPGADHSNWTPDFEYLTRPDVMTKLFDKAMSESEVGHG